jgi:hypothetical protein
LLEVEDFLVLPGDHGRDFLFPTGEELFSMGDVAFAVDDRIFVGLELREPGGGKATSASKGNGNERENREEAKRKVDDALGVDRERTRATPDPAKSDEVRNEGRVGRENAREEGGKESIHDENAKRSTRTPPKRKKKRVVGEEERRNTRRRNTVLTFSPPPTL